MFVLTTVGYTADTMYFSPLDSPLELDLEIGANVDNLTVHDCSQSYTTGTSTLYYSFYLLHLQFLMFLGVCSIIKFQTGYSTPFIVRGAGEGC